MAEARQGQLATDCGKGAEGFGLCKQTTCVQRSAQLVLRAL